MLLRSDQKKYGEVVNQTSLFCSLQVRLHVESEQGMKFIQTENEIVKTCRESCTLDTSLRGSFFYYE